MDSNTRKEGASLPVSDVDHYVIISTLLHYIANILPISHVLSSVRLPYTKYEVLWFLEHTNFTNSSAKSAFHFWLTSLTPMADR
jgi:hypothetical protein